MNRPFEKRGKKPAWGAFEPVQIGSLTPVKFGSESAALFEKEAHASMNPAAQRAARSIDEAEINVHLENLKAVAEDRAGTRILREHLPEVTEAQKIEIPSDKSEEDHFSSNPWVLHKSFPYYRQFLSNDLPSRTRRRKAQKETENSGKKPDRPLAWNTWSLIPKQSSRVTREIRAQSTKSEFHKNESIYRDEFPTFIAQSHKGACQLPVSLYTQNRLEPDGITVLRDFITDAEEKDIISEIMSTTLHRGKDATKPTNYIPEDGRYCTNYFDEELSVLGKGTLAWSTSDLPTVGEVLLRAFKLNILPLMPNTFQINEYVTNFAGFQKHKKPRMLGSYIGILSLISADVLRLYHDVHPWAPRIYLEPRSLVVLQRDARYEYSMATARDKRPKYRHNTRNFRDSFTRTHMNFVNFTKDYRIDVLFAHVDAAEHKALDIAQKMTLLSSEEKKVEKKGE